MGNWQRPASFLVGLALAAGGCSDQDTDHLARVAKCAASKSEGLTRGADGQLLSWSTISGNLDELPLDTRVAARLRWDKNLEGTPIDVKLRDDVIELKGTVRDLEQRRRAVDLAQSTMGVGADKVADRLEVAAP